MSGKQVEPDPNEMRVSTQRGSPLNLDSSQDNSPRGVRHHPNPARANYSPGSSNSSLESNRSPVNYTPRSSSSSPPTSKLYFTLRNSPHEKNNYSSRRGSMLSGHDNVSSGSNERGVVRPGSDTYANAPGSNLYGNPQGYSPYGNPQGYSPYGNPQEYRPYGNPQEYNPHGYPQYPPPDDNRLAPYDNDDTEENAFMDKSIRRAFIRKVYFLIMCMMIFASGVISFMMLHQPTRGFVLRNMWLVIVSWVLYPTLLMILICCEKVRRTVPWNYIVLFLVTLALSFMAGCSATRFNKFEVLAAFGITAVLCLGLTIFAFQTKWDFTVISGGLVIASLVMLILGIVLIFWRNKIAMIGYSCLGALLGCFFFIFDTQMIIGGNHRYAINPEEYVFAAITLFSDMINIFIMVMNIIGLSRS